MLITLDIDPDSLDAAFAESLEEQLEVLEAAVKDEDSFYGNKKERTAMRDAMKLVLDYYTPPGAKEDNE